MREWWTLPYAFARSSQQTASDLCFFRASWMTVASLRWCSMHPGVRGMNAFWVPLSRYLLDSMKDSHRRQRIVVKSLPTQGVRAMGRKLFGRVGSSSAASFPISFTDAVFHCRGTTDCVQQVLKRSCSASCKAGHFLKTWYEMPSSGQGADLALDFLTTAEISSKVISPQLNSATGAEGDGIQCGSEKDCGSA